MPAAGRLLVHASAFNLVLMMRTLFGIGTPRTLQGRAVAALAVLGTVWNRVCDVLAPISTQPTRRSNARRANWRMREDEGSQRHLLFLSIRTTLMPSTSGICRPSSAKSVRSVVIRLTTVLA
jgi:hypothetical protein